MTYAFLIICIVIATVISGATLSWSLYALDVTSLGAIAVSIVLISGVLTVAGVLSLLGIGVRSIYHREIMHYQVVRQSVRQGLLLGCFLATLLMFEKWELFSWVTVILLLLFFMSIELYATSGEH